MKHDPELPAFAHKLPRVYTYTTTRFSSHYYYMYYYGFSLLHTPVRWVGWNRV